MNNRQRVWLWLSAAVLFIVGFILVLNDSGAGWFLIILGITYLVHNQETFSETER
jgi:hypothetical protein